MNVKTTNYQYGTSVKSQASFGKAQLKVQRSLPMSSQKLYVIVKYMALEYGLIKNDTNRRCIGKPYEIIEQVRNVLSVMIYHTGFHPLVFFTGNCFLFY